MSRNKDEVQVHRRAVTRQHTFRTLCATIGIEHWLTSPRSPQTKGMVKWSCSAYVPVSQLIYAALRSKAKGLFPPSEECRRLGLLNPLIYWNIAPSAWRLVSQRLRQIISALMDLKNVSTMELS